MATIYVYLMDEGCDVWRPAPAIDHGDGTWTLLATECYDPTDEHWQFTPGARVVCEARRLSGGPVWVATRLASEMDANRPPME